MKKTLLIVGGCLLGLLLVAFGSAYYYFEVRVSPEDKARRAAHEAKMAEINAEITEMEADRQASEAKFRVTPASEDLKEKVLKITQGMAQGDVYLILGRPTKSPGGMDVWEIGDQKIYIDYTSDKYGGDIRVRSKRLIDF